MTKKILPEKTSENFKDLIFNIPLQQRKRMVKSKAYRRLVGYPLNFTVNIDYALLLLFFIKYQLNKNLDY